MKECYNCRESLEANASYCYGCTEKSIGQDNMSKYKDLGGWLLFFMVWSVIAVILNLVTAFREFGAISTLREHVANDATLSISDVAFNIMTIVAIMSFVVITINIVHIIQVVNRRSRFLFFYQLGHILGLITGIMGLITISMIEGAPGIGSMIWSMLVAIGSLLLFTLYYSSSVRVRVYMDSDEYFTKAIFTLKDKDEAFIRKVNNYEENSDSM